MAKKPKSPSNPYASLGLPFDSKGKYKPVKTHAPLIKAPAPTPLEGLSLPGGTPLFEPYQPPVQQAPASVPKAASASVSKPAVATGPAAKTFADYLATAQNYVAPGTDYDALMAQERANAGDSTARIAAMYKQLQGSYAADEPGIQQNFNGAQQAVGTNAADATAGINQAYQGTRDAQAAELQKLGIGDAAGVLASAGNNAGNDQARALAAVATNAAGNQNNLAQHSANAVQYNTGIKQAAGLEGNLQQAVIQKQLNDALANLQTQQSTAQGSRSTDVFNEALQLQNLDQNGGLTAAQQATQDAAYAKIAADSAKSKSSQSNQAKQNETQTYLSLLKQFGGDDSKALAEFKALKAAGLVS